MYEEYRRLLQTGKCVERNAAGADRTSLRRKTHLLRHNTRTDKTLRMCSKVY